MNKFDRVELKSELPIYADGMPKFRDCFDHEILLSFFDDIGKVAFQQWWREEGSEIFAVWLGTNFPQYKWE